MGNLFDKIGTCYTCYDEGLIFYGSDNDNFISDFCSDCEIGTRLASDYAVWYATNELNEYTLEKENA